MSKIIQAFIRKFSSIPIYYPSIQPLIPQIATKLLSKASQIKEGETQEILLGAYVTLIGTSDAKIQQEIISEHFLDLSLDLCLSRVRKNYSKNLFFLIVEN